MKKAINLLFLCLLLCKPAAARHIKWKEVRNKTNSTITVNGKKIKPKRMRYIKLPDKGKLEIKLYEKGDPDSKIKRIWTYSASSTIARARHISVHKVSQPDTWKHYYKINLYDGWGRIMMGFDH